MGNWIGKGKESSMIINVHAGHNPAGKIACGAVGLIDESTENRKVKEEVIRELRELGHTVYDCTVNNGASQADVLKRIVEKCNAHTADLDISIHFNSAAKDEEGDGRTTGTEVFVYSASSSAAAYAEKVCSEIAALGFRNRGVKYSSGLYVLKNTKAPAMLIECCFVDDRDDVELYHYRKMAAAIVRGITGKNAGTADENPGNPDNQKKEEQETGQETEKAPLYRVQAGAYTIKANAEAMKEKLKKAGIDAVIIQA